MAAPPPRLAPTLMLAAAWLAIYLLYLAVRPDQPRVDRPASSVSTSTTTEPAAKAARGS